MPLNGMILAASTIETNLFLNLSLLFEESREVVFMVTGLDLAIV